MRMIIAVIESILCVFDRNGCETGNDASGTTAHTFLGGENMKGKTFFLAVLFLMVFCFGGGTDSAWAKYPDKKIQFIAAFEPGGGSDLVARTLVKYANPFLGGRLFVENTVGGSGSIGFRAGAKANPDGYTLTMIVTSLTVAPHITKDFPPYDIFDPICIVAQDSTVLSVKQDSPHETAAFADAAGVKFTLLPSKGLTLHCPLPGCTYCQRDGVRCDCIPTERCSCAARNTTRDKKGACRGFPEGHRR
jgi:hypothetical protein